MDLIHKFLNLVAPPFTFFSLCLFLPSFYAFKFFLSTLSSVFSESIEGKVVLITGASSGIGEHLAYEYARRGACLAPVARREISLWEVAERARELGSPEVIVIQADVTRVDDCRRLVNETMNHFQRLDHLVNNAGINSICNFEDAEDITNFRGVMVVAKVSDYTTRFAVPYLRNSRGKIIVLSSSFSWLPKPRMSFYNASKAALVSMFETLTVELGPDIGMGPDIGITTVMPGFIESELTKGKHFTKEGKLEVDQDSRDVQVSMIPVVPAQGCAKAIVNSAYRGDRYLTEPAWFKMTYRLKAFCPEIIEWTYRLLHLAGTREPPTEAPSKKLVDLPGAKKLVYPSTIQTPQIKTE